jgi:hypothetical protein
MCRPAFDALDRSWANLARSGEAAAALARWQPDAVLAVADLDELVAGVWAASKPHADRVHAALAALAPNDTTAARVLLQMLRPGLRSLGRRLAFGGSFDDVDCDVLALAWEQIRTYRTDHRPASIAANILLDVRKRYVRSMLEARRDVVNLDEVPNGRRPAAPSAEDDAMNADCRAFPGPLVARGRRRPGGHHGDERNGRVAHTDPTRR